MIYKYSRYTKSNLYDRDGVLTFERRNRIDFSTKSYRTHMLVDGDTLDNISFKYYNTTQLWWVILDANPTLNQFDIESNKLSGTELKIPEYDEVMLCLQ